MPRKRTSKPKKRGPKEERFVREDPQDGRLEATMALKAEFDATHADGMRALKQRDFDALARVVERERDIIKRQKDRIARQRKKTT